MFNNSFIMPKLKHYGWRFSLASNQPIHSRLYRSWSTDKGMAITFTKLQDHHNPSQGEATFNHRNDNLHSYLWLGIIFSGGAPLSFCASNAAQFLVYTSQALPRVLSSTVMEIARVVEGSERR